MFKKIKDRTGERFGRLVVKQFSGSVTKTGRNALWNCLCDCGNEIVASSSHLITGAVQSCGCLAKERSSKRIKLLHNQGKHLYLIQCGDYIKIGRTDNINKRLSHLQVYNPYEIKLITVLENEGYREKEFHKLFKNKHHKGEWFKLTQDDLQLLS